MPVFFIQARDVVDGLVIIRGNLFQHLAKSLRTKPGQPLTFNDEEGTRYLTSVHEVTKEVLTAQVKRTETQSTPSPLPLILGQAILKGDKMSWVIQKATELGVDVIVPLQTERVIAKAQPSHKKNFENRWIRIALEAAQQSERWKPPIIAPIASFQEFINAYSETPTKLMLAERAKGLRLAEQPLPTTRDHSIVVAIGPEGGWALEELAAADTANFSFTSLGEHILRAETASLATLAILQSRLQQL